MRKFDRFSVLLLIACSAAICLALETGQFRLLSVSESSKLILVSQIPSKAKYLLDASTAKITRDGKPAEYRNLQSFSIIQVKYELKKSTKDGIEIDGTATEIKITSPQEIGKQPQSSSISQERQRIR